MGLSHHHGFWYRLGHWLLACLEARANRFGVTPRQSTPPDAGRKRPH